MEREGLRERRGQMEIQKGTDENERRTERETEVERWGRERGLREKGTYEEREKAR